MKADHVNNTKSDKAIATIKRFSINFISGDHNQTARKMDGSEIFWLAP